jgi:hypothetical protein
MLSTCLAERSRLCWFSIHLSQRAALEPERNHFPETLIAKEYSHDTD